MKDTQNFTAQRLPNGVAEITDLSGVHCFLVEGRDKALLIDTMTGLRGLPAFVATLTDLPVEVALTHGHMDHAGGVFEFGRCYIHPADIPMLDGHTLPARVGYVRGQLPPGEAPEASAFVPDGPVEFVPLKAGGQAGPGRSRFGGPPRAGAHQGLSVLLGYGQRGLLCRGRLQQQHAADDGRLRHH